MNRIINQSNHVVDIKDEYGGVVDAIMLRKHNLRVLVRLTAKNTYVIDTHSYCKIDGKGMIVHGHFHVSESTLSGITAAVNELNNRRYVRNIRNDSDV